MVPHNAMQTFIRLGLFDGFDFCEKTFTRKALCDITDIYNTFASQTKKNFKVLMDKIFSDEELTFEELFAEDKIVRLIDSFKLDVTEEYTEKELINFELKYIGFRISENQERIQYMMMKKTFHFFGQRLVQ